jgi:predicted short-subunit dehydrogenase-like oxidoreductase (DUF2520 family)
MQTFGVIGLGKLGLSIAVGLSTQGRLAWTMNRSAEQRNASKFLLPPSLPMYPSINAVQAPAPCIILAVADEAIAEVSHNLAEHFGARLSDLVVMHCSGRKNRNVLQTCEAAGAITMGLHPYQTFATATAKNFKDIVWGAEYNPQEPFRTIAEQFAQDLVYALGGKIIPLSPETLAHKPLYHASAVFAANYTNALIGLAAETAAAAGIDPSEFLPTIARRALENALAGIRQLDKGKFPLSGPISRGDLAAIREHIAHFRATGASRETLVSYCHIGIATAEFAGKQGILDAAKRDDLIALLRQELENGA